MTEFSEGDLIEAAKGDTVIRGKAWNDCTGTLNIGGTGWSVERIEARGYAVTLIEKAAPALPAAEGWYSVVRDGHPSARLLRLNHGRWSEYNSDGLHSPVWLAEAAMKEGRLTRLEPVADTAKKVLERVESILSAGGIHALPNAFSGLAKEFGIQS